MTAEAGGEHRVAARSHDVLEHRSASEPRGASIGASPARASRNFCLLLLPSFNLRWNARARVSAVRTVGRARICTTGWDTRADIAAVQQSSPVVTAKPRDLPTGRAPRADIAAVHCRPPSSQRGFAIFRPPALRLRHPVVLRLAAPSSGAGSLVAQRGRTTSEIENGASAPSLHSISITRAVLSGHRARNRARSSSGKPRRAIPSLNFGRPRTRSARCT